ncbi:MAG TPA: alpha/beta hydrolase, partial [Anaerolineales bacterium]|nr:alpha/beta hydrolase [Anaerolineales bacterium]
MKTNYLLSILVLFGGLLFVGCRTVEAPVPVVPEGAQAGELIGLEGCEFQPAGGKTIYAAECGTLVVPENWDKPDSRLIALPVARIPAKGPNAEEPVFFLQGGPGETNLSWAPSDWLLENHDFVMIGYRGVDGTVTLSCPQVDRLVDAHMGRDLFSEQARAEYAAAVKDCASTHQEAGVDLSGYTIPGVVEDMESARIALGYEQINLLSASYGTRIAQIYAYMYPDSLHRLVLIGVNTPGHFIWDPIVFDEMIEHISELCDRDATCSSRTNDFARTMHTVNRNMPERWLFFNIDSDSVRLGTHALFFANPNMPMVIDAYLSAENGDPSGLAMMNLMGTIMPLEAVLGDQFSKGGTTDLEKYLGAEKVGLGDSIMGAPFTEIIWTMVVDWPIELISKDLREFQESDVEMLLVNGTVDFSTPPTALEEAKPYFHKAQ